MDCLVCMFGFMLLCFKFSLFCGVAWDIYAVGGSVGKTRRPIFGARPYLHALECTYDHPDVYLGHLVPMWHAEWQDQCASVHAAFPMLMCDDTIPQRICLHSAPPECRHAPRSL